MTKVKIKVENRSKFACPEYQHPSDSGMDVRANIDEDIILQPMERKLIPTGIFVELPEDYEIQVRPRSGLALKCGLTVLNTPGTVDSGYRNEIGVILINLSGEPQTIIPGERIAQFVLAHVEKAEIELIEAVDINTDRGTTGYGDSGRV